jgi:allantoate deiminase
VEAEQTADPPVADGRAGLPPAAATAAARVLRRCDEVAGCTESPGRVCRRYGTAALTAAMDLIAGWMRDAGLETRRDAIGNLIGRSPGGNPDAPAFALGSHLDSVPDGGRYDGALGVLVAIEAVAGMTAGGAALPFRLEVVAFADEEGARFHTTYLGSRAYAGRFDPALLDRTDADGASLASACADFGGHPDRLVASCSPLPVLGYLEVHIEQGPALEALGAPLGIVTAIAGQTRAAVGFRGEAGHAGTVAMALRRDALAAAAEAVLSAERLAQETPALLATVGRIDVLPGASNVVPGAARITLDVRSPNDAVRKDAVRSLRGACVDAGERRNVGVDWEVVQDDPATAMDAGLSGGLAASLAAVGLPVHRLPSGAGHDAVVMAEICPVAMLFVRCAGGISHHPDEAVAAGDVAAAVAVVSDFLRSRIGSFNPGVDGGNAPGRVEP